MNIRKKLTGHAILLKEATHDDTFCYLDYTFN